MHENLFLLISKLNSSFDQESISGIFPKYVVYLFEKPDVGHNQGSDLKIGVRAANYYIKMSILTQAR